MQFLMGQTVCLPEVARSLHKSLQFYISLFGGLLICKSESESFWTAGSQVVRVYALKSGSCGFESQRQNGHFHLLILEDLNDSVNVDVNW